MNISIRLYRFLLFAYPAEFRRKFAVEMLQVFRDCYRAEASSGSVPGFWLRTLVDLILSAAKERSDNSGRQGVFMNRRSDAMILLISFGIIVIAFLLHRYGIRNNLAYVYVVGYALDALITTGVLGNLIVFLLNKTTKLNPLRTAISVFAMVHGVLLLLIVVLSRSIGPANWAGVLIGHLVSFVIWVGLYFAWHTTSRNPAINNQQ